MTLLRDYLWHYLGMDATTFAPLLTPEGWQLLANLPDYQPDQALKVAVALRKQGYSPELIAAALTQQRLRDKAQAKFGPYAQRMLFTPDGVEQASRLQVAALHAQRFVKAGARHVADMGCGIGSDTLALAELGLQVSAVEMDEATAALATVNLMPYEQVQVINADATSLDLTLLGVDAIFADPARRANGRRISDPEAWSPGLSTVLSWRQQVPNLGVKVAPGIDYAALPSDAHVQWISDHGTVIEAGIWCGDLALEGSGRSALVIDDDGAHRLLDIESDPSTTPTQLKSAPELGEYLFEPDGAVIRAGLVAKVAEQLTAAPIAPQLAYLTGNCVLPNDLIPFVRAWKIVQTLPTKPSALKAWAKRADIGALEIHKRGIDVEPEALRKRLHLQGTKQATIVLTRQGNKGRGKAIALLVEPTN